MYLKTINQLRKLIGIIFGRDGEEKGIMGHILIFLDDFFRELLIAVFSGGTRIKGVTVGTGDDDFGDHGGGHFQVIQKLVTAGDVAEIHERIFTEKNLLHVGKVGKLNGTLLNAVKLGIKLCFDTFGKSLKRALELILGKGIYEQIV